MVIEENILLKNFCTFRMGGPARYFVRVEADHEISKAFEFAYEKKLPTFILGGGSNIVVSDKGFAGVVIRMENKGIEIIEENREEIYIKVESGELWDDVVRYAIQQNAWGIENMSIVPGNMGAVSVQNVGCYGQEASDVVDRVQVWDSVTNNTKILTGSECNFSYRKSTFNSDQKNRYVIASTIIGLAKQGHANVTYPDLQVYFDEHGMMNPSLEDIRLAIISIRSKKFADPKKIGTAGSFFKNFYLNPPEYENMRQTVTRNFSAEIAEKLDVIAKKFSTSSIIKIPLAFFIDELCHLKGTREGGVEISKTQALAILNFAGTATSDDVLRLIRHVKKAVYSACGRVPDIEPELIGFNDSDLELIHTIT